MNRRTGWQALGEWAFGFALVSLVMIGAITIGMFILPFAAIALGFAGARDRAWPEVPFGALVGVGTACLFIAYLNRDYSPCPTGPMRLVHGQHFSCGGFDPRPWLLVGFFLVATGIIGYVVARHARLAAATT